VLLGVELFFSGEGRFLIWSAPILMLAALTRFPAALMFLVLVGYDVMARRGVTALTRPFVISTVLAGVVALPCLTWMAWAFGNPLHAWQASGFMMPSLSGAARLRGLLMWAHWLLYSPGWVLCGLAAVASVTLLSRSSQNAPNIIPAPGVLIGLWIAIVTAYFCLTVRPLFDRYMFLALPPLFMLIGEALVTISAMLGGRRQRVRLALLVVSGLVASLALWRDADRGIRHSRASYAVLRDVGEWLKDTTGRDALVMSQSVAQITYYSDRAGVPLAESPEATRAFLRESEDHYLVISSYEKKPPWLVALVNDRELRAVGSFSQESAEGVILRAAATRAVAR
jgi:hypothetical protein